ncbi:MAG: class I SAM-dependent methyltransferase [Pseudomonadota bacterium]
MNRIAKSFDPIWEEAIYGEGQHLNRYPFDIVVSFVYRNYPRHKPREEIRILEVGCGAGNNLWFAAREGFQVAGIDASESAIAYARKRFSEEGLKGDFRVGDFTHLPFNGDVFDLAIDRGALTCCGFSAAKKAVVEVRRILREGGRFLFNPYSEKHSSRAAGRPGADGLTLDITGGTLIGVGQLCFWGRREIDAVLSTGWKLLRLQHHELVERLEQKSLVHAEWRVIAQKAALE